MSVEFEDDQFEMNGDPFFIDDENMVVATLPGEVPNIRTGEEGISTLHNEVHVQVDCLYHKPTNFLLEISIENIYFFSEIGEYCEVGVRVGDSIMKIDDIPITSLTHRTDAVVHLLIDAAWLTLSRISEVQVMVIEPSKHAGVLEFNHIENLEPAAKRLNTGQGTFQRCRFENCQENDIGYGACSAHGGGRQCREINCETPAVYQSGLCVAHGGQSTCSHEGCIKSTQGSSGVCVAHGGGRRCTIEGCFKLDQGGGNCKLHGGGRRCGEVHCTKAAQGGSGYCVSHGGGTRCKYEDCVRHVVGAGLCRAHGGGKKCLLDSCLHFANGSSFYCKRHGGGRRCSEEGCPRGAVGTAQRCVRHGGGKRCGNASGCVKSAVGKSSFCVAHGGGTRCEAEACSKAAVGPTKKCKAHGGGRRCRHPDGCSKSAEGTMDRCKGHGGGKRCVAPDCNRSARGATAFCVGHGGGKRCIEGCGRAAQGSTLYCVTHGGGRRCKEEGCSKLDQGGGLCKSHGGGKRCISAGCNKASQGSDGYCVSHGGGRRCTFEGCTRHDAGGGLCRSHGAGKKCKIAGCDKFDSGGGLCKSHGGGKRCIIEDCNKSAAEGKSEYCVNHGGGKRCVIEGCSKGARGSSELCVNHGGGRRCGEPGCNKHDAGRGKCKAHGGGRRCMFDLCQKSATGIGNKDYCISHGGGKRCAHNDCATSARHGSVYCRQHNEAHELPSTSSSIQTALRPFQTNLRPMTATIMIPSLSEPRMDILPREAAIDCWCSGMGDTDDAATAFQRLHPREFLHRFISQGVRLDGRGLGDYRDTSIVKGFIKDADGSAKVDIGNTSVVSGVRYLVACPGDERPFTINVKLLPICNPLFDGRPSELSSSLALSMEKVVYSCLDQSELSIQEAVACFILSIDVVVIDDDGNIFDAALLAVMASLQDLCLPSVELVDDTQGGKEVVQIGETCSRKVNLTYIPVPLTMGLFGDHILADPTFEESQVVDGTISIVLDQKGTIALIYKPDGPALEYRLLETCIDTCLMHSKTLLY